MDVKIFSSVWVDGPWVEPILKEHFKSDVLSRDVIEKVCNTLGRNSYCLDPEALGIEGRIFRAFGHRPISKEDERIYRQMRHAFKVRNWPDHFREEVEKLVSSQKVGTDIKTVYGIMRLLSWLLEDYKPVDEIINTAPGRKNKPDNFLLVELFNTLPAEPSKASKYRAIIALCNAWCDKYNLVKPEITENKIKGAIRRAEKGRNSEN